MGEFQMIEPKVHENNKILNMFQGKCGVSKHVSNIGWRLAYPVEGISPKVWSVDSLYICHPPKDV